MSITHPFVSGKSDGADSTLVRPTNWNAAHSVAAIGCGVYHSSDFSLSTSGEGLIQLDTNYWDTNTFHFINNSNLTGTVSKTNGSATITGSSTLFTTELSVNQVILIPGGSTEVGVVKTITNNTTLDVWVNLTNTSSGQTAQRSNSYLAIPAGKGGKYLMTMHGRVDANQNAYLIIRQGGSITSFIALFDTESWNSNNSFGICRDSTVLNIVEGDWLEFKGIAGGATNLKTPTSGHKPFISLLYVGT